MPEKHRKLSSKIIGILVVFFLVATTAIGMTLVISWQLEGASAAINDAGSQRMRSYRLGWLLHKIAADPTMATAVRDEMQIFEKVLGDLERGDPRRPLIVSRDPEIRIAVAKMRDDWSQRMRPLIASILATTDPVERDRKTASYDAEVGAYVQGVNALVLDMERNYAHAINTLRLFQLGLVMLALIGTVVLIYYFFVLVIRPVQQLQAGIGRMASEDFSVRLPVVNGDEFGLLATGFNDMAGHLQSLYATLGERVEAKTRSLEDKNRELAALYNVAAFFNESAALDELCRGFLQRVMEAVSAEGGAVRLFDDKTQKLYLQVHRGVSSAFAEREASLCAGECVCGEAVQTGKAQIFMVSSPPPQMSLNLCRREGFETVAAFSITSQKRQLGIFNLYFTDARQLDTGERHLLETLGQHLGSAVENQRLVSRDKELAVTEERNLLAQELHDSIAQSLAFLNIKVQLLVDALKKNNVSTALEESALIREGIQESYDDVRELLTHFRTRVSEADIEAAIASALQKFEGQTGIATEFRRLGHGAPLPAEYETQLLHIVQESLSNIRKHAGAALAEVTLEHGLRDVTLAIHDNGQGFDPGCVASDEHVGVRIMKERAHRIGALFEIRSHPGIGTTVRVVLPRNPGDSE